MPSLGLPESATTAADHRRLQHRSLRGVVGRYVLRLGRMLGGPSPPVAGRWPRSGTGTGGTRSRSRLVQLRSGPHRCRRPARSESPGTARRQPGQHSRSPATTPDPRTRPTRPGLVARRGMRDRWGSPGCIAARPSPLLSIHGVTWQLPSRTTADRRDHHTQPEPCTPPRARPGVWFLVGHRSPLTIRRSRSRLSRLSPASLDLPARGNVKSLPDVGRLACGSGSSPPQPG